LNRVKPSLRRRTAPRAPSAISADPSDTAIDLLRYAAREWAHEAATFHRTPAGTWIATTWSTLWHEVQRAASAFSELGLRRGDRLGILSHTCREWQVAELGSNLLGAAVVGIEPHASNEQIGRVLEHAGVSALVVDRRDILSKIREDLRSRFTFTLLLQDEPLASDGCRSWGQVVADRLSVVESSPAIPSPDDAAMVIYTSGTTGAPKGIEYTNRDLMTACRAMLDEFHDFGRSRLVCWLPMAALFQRMMNILALATGSVTYFVEDPREIMTRLPEIRPTVFTSVPRFYEKLHDGIHDRLRGLKGAQKWLCDAALRAGEEWGRDLRSGKRPSIGLRLRYRALDRLVLRRIRSAMGGEVQWMISGSAAAPVWLLEFFQSIGLLILEAYGISENPVPLAANRSDAYRFGSVGRPFRINQLKLAADGEVLVKGPAQFRGYVREGMPADRMAADGYYRTGDYGRLDSDGFLYLTGRGTEIIKTSGGRRISSAAVEGVYRQSRYVDQIVVIGNDRPYLAALVTLTTGSPAADAELGAVLRDTIAQDLAELGRQLARHEQVRAIGILGAPLSVESGELTGSLKLRRDRIEARHASLIDKLYSGRGPGAPGESDRPAVILEDTPG
jgi:long-chain acyl-CoA synthetase